MTAGTVTTEGTPAAITASNPADWSDAEAREHVTRAEARLSALASLPDPAAREQALDALQSLAELYGACLARVMRHVDGETAAALAADELAGHLLLVHELHPEPAEQRLRRALEDVRGAELAAVEGRTVRVRLSPQGCGGPTAEALEQHVREVVAWSAPEIDEVETEEAGTPETVIPVDSLFRRGGQPAAPR